MQADGKYWSVPWEWGYSTVAYNPEMIEVENATYDIFIDPRFKGKTALPSSIGVNILIAGVIVSFVPCYVYSCHAGKLTVIPIWHYWSGTDTKTPSITRSTTPSMGGNSLPVLRVVAGSAPCETNQAYGQGTQENTKCNMTN